MNSDAMSRCWIDQIYQHIQSGIFFENLEETNKVSKKKKKKVLYEKMNFSSPNSNS